MSWNQQSRIQIKLAKPKVGPLKLLIKLINTQIEGLMVKNRSSRREMLKNYQYQAIPIDPIVVTLQIKNYYEQLYVTIFFNLDEMDKLFENTIYRS